MSECVEWTKSLNANGYGQATPDPGRTTRLAHRREWERTYGPIPDDMTIDHLCFNPKCINVAHMEVVTHRTNTQRRSARQTACLRGHPFTEANTYNWRGQRRVCRTCSRERMQLWRSARCGK